MIQKILSKWYFTLVALPFCINLLSNHIGVPVLFENWSITIIVTLSFLTIILFVELYTLAQKNKELQFSPRKKDKEIVLSLLAHLDIDTFHKDIVNQDSWYGYRKEAMGKAIDFNHYADLMSNQTSDKKLNELIKGLKDAIEIFTNYSSMELYGSGEFFYKPAKDTDYNMARAIKSRPIMNGQTDLAFERLTILLSYLRKKNYI